MKPLRCEWELSTDVVGMTLPLHLDSLVAYAQTEEHLRTQDLDVMGAELRELAAELPLRKHSNNGDWCWMASALIPSQQAGHSMRMWTRKTDVYDYAHRVEAQQINVRFQSKPYEARINTNSGLMKNCFQFIPARTIRKFTAYCIGDPDRLLELLSPESGYINHLGARGRSGFGRIKCFEIVEDEAASIHWSQRILPWPQDGFEPIYAANKPPYWAAENKVMSYIPAHLLC